MVTVTIFSPSGLPPLFCRGGVCVDGFARVVRSQANQRAFLIKLAQAGRSQQLRQQLQGKEVGSPVSKASMKRKSVSQTGCASWSGPRQRWKSHSGSCGETPKRPPPNPRQAPKTARRWRRSGLS